MKSYIKKIAAVVSAVSIIGTMSISVSAATADDVVAAARSAGPFIQFIKFMPIQKTGNHVDVIDKFLILHKKQGLVPKTVVTIKNMRQLPGHGSTHKSICFRCIVITDV